MTFENKVVFVTGAGSGIGEAIALRFARLSARLSLLDVNPESLEKVIKTCENLSKTKALKIVLDLTKDEDVKLAVDKTIEEFGKIDILINCAAIARRVGLLESDFIKSFDKELKVNLRSYIVVSHYAATALVERKGCIINIASVHTRMVDFTGADFVIDSGSTLLGSLNEYRNN